MSERVSELKKHFEANMLDGYKLEDCGGWMLEAKHVFEYISETFGADLEPLDIESLAKFMFTVYYPSSATPKFLDKKKPYYRVAESIVQHFARPSAGGLRLEEIEDILKKLLLIPKPLDKKPTIAELEKILNSNEQHSIGMLPDGSIQCLRPQISLKELAQAIFEAQTKSEQEGGATNTYIDHNTGETICASCGHSQPPAEMCIKDSYQQNDSFKCACRKCSSDAVKELVEALNRVIPIAENGWCVDGHSAKRIIIDNANKIISKHTNKYEADGSDTQTECAK